MENLRFVLVVSLVLVGSLLWQAWQEDYGPPPEERPPASAPPPARLPPAPETQTAVSEPPGRTVSRPGVPVEVRTDVLRLELNTIGATLSRADLLRYPVRLETPDVPMTLLDDSPDQFYVVQGGLLAQSTAVAPTHETVFSVAQQSHVLAPGQDSLTVPFGWSSQEIQITKEFVFTRGSYEIGIRYRVNNGSTEPWVGRSYAQIQRLDPGKAGRRLVYTYTGAVVSSPEKRYEKIDFDDMRESKLERDISNGWIAMLQHYFVTALLPVSTDVPYRYYTSSLSDNRFAAGMISPALEVPARGQGILEQRLYVGPKVQKLLERAAEGLNLTVDYGYLWFLAKPLFICLVWLRDLTGNWGWAIILVTVLLKVLFYRLSAAGYRSMANMRRVQPRLKAIQERYKDDRARLNQAMMQIYKEEKINPFGGCLPILIQIPVFIALYWVLLESVEMRQVPWVLWIRDLSSPDPYWVLPLIMGATMFLQQKLNPAPLDPVQEKVMQIMPFAFTIFFGFFPSGLVLYWVANNILSIGQQWLITRGMERGAKDAH
ncbi:MAG: membrane protein insertase YidC [Gammaproteobacteria bacterium]|nr:membrane protein insertase YidC [Gammaproteobacteria bacterium]